MKGAAFGIVGFPHFDYSPPRFWTTGSLAQDGPGRLFTGGRPGKGELRTGQWIGRVVLAAASAPIWGCAHGPRSFREVQNQAPVVRARAVGLGRRQSVDSVVPALVERLSDNDPVVRLAAHEELRKRTGRDFGYVPWADPQERAGAVNRWRAWMNQGTGTVDRQNGPPAPPSKMLPVGSSQAPGP